MSSCVFCLFSLFHLFLPPFTYASNWTKSMTSEMSTSHRWAEITTPLSNQHDRAKEQLVTLSWDQRPCLGSAPCPASQPGSASRLTACSAGAAQAQRGPARSSEALPQAHRSRPGMRPQGSGEPCGGRGLLQSQPCSQPHPHGAAFIRDGFTRLSRHEAESSWKPGAVSSSCPGT